MVELSSLDVRVLARELRALEDAYIDKVHEPAPNVLLFKMRQPDRGAMHLLVRPGKYAALTSDPPKSPDQPSTVAMTLRKMLTSARIRRVEQHEFDRVLRLQLDRRGEEGEMVIELFGKGNLILAGPGGTILFAARTETFAHRTIKRGEVLVLPPPRVNPINLPRSRFEELAAASEKDVVRFLALDVALGGDLAEEVVHRAGLAKAARVRDLAPAEAERAWSALRELIDGDPRPAVASSSSGLRVESVPLTAPVFQDAQRTPAASLSEAILQVAETETFEEEHKPDEEAARLERQISHQERGVVELGKEAGRWERRGHLLYSHYEASARGLQKAKAAVEALGWSGFAELVKAPKDEDAWARDVKAVDPKRAKFQLKLEDEELPLDPMLSLEQNATILYDESKRVRAKQANAKVALEEGRRRLVERRIAVPAAVRKQKGVKAPTKRFWFDHLRWFPSSEGFLVVAGRDAASNEKLVKRHLGAGDRYVHADFHGAASVVVRCEGKAPGEATMKEACQFAAVSSKAFNQFAVADAYWVTPEQVSKTAESGEFIPKGAFIIRGTRHYHVKLKLELALALLTFDGMGRFDPKGAHRRLVGGPPEAILHYTGKVARIERGDQKPTDAAKRLAPLFGVSIDEVVAVLPSGTVRIVSEPGATP